MTKSVKQNEYLDYMLDPVFKYLMQLNDNRLYLTYILTYLIKELTVEDIKNGVFLNSEVLLKNIKHQRKYLDLLFYIKSKNLYLLLEMNREEKGTVEKNINYLKEVSLWFQKENKEARFILINFDNFSKYSWNDINEYGMYSNTELRYHSAENSKIIHINVAKIRKMKYTLSVERNIFLQCIKMLGAESKKELNEAIGKNKELKKVSDNMFKFLKKEGPNVRSWKEEMKNREFFIGNAYKEEGMKQGIQKGRQDEKIKTAENMLKDNIPVEAIVKYTNLSKEKINSIQIR